MNNWRGYLLFLIFGGIILFLILAIPYVIYTDIKCTEAGGRPTRIGCVNPAIFLEKE